MKLTWKQPVFSFCSSFLTQALKTSAATFKEQKHNQESSRVCITRLVKAGLCAADAHPLCVQTDNCRRRKTSSGAQPSDLDRTGILQVEGPSCKATTCRLANPSLQEAQLQLKRARLAGESNKTISHRPAPIFRHILPLPSRTQPDIKGDRKDTFPTPLHFKAPDVCNGHKWLWFYL